MEAVRIRQIYQFKVALLGISPQIWRRIQVWADSTLDQLHRVLQLIMGWENQHLFEFHLTGAKYRDPHPENGLEILNAKRTRLDRVLHRTGARLEYLYDFGDCWLHDLRLEAILPPSLDSQYPRCIDGERNCPPEDVGGPEEYEHYLRALTDLECDEHEEMFAWRGPFDPEDFSIEKVNQQLKKEFRPMWNRSASKSDATNHKH